ncbi:unnamed protein product, partial [Brassica oleracea]
SENIHTLKQPLSSSHPPHQWEPLICRPDRMSSVY